MAKEKTVQPVKAETDNERRLRLLKTARDNKPLTFSELKELREMLALTHDRSDQLSVSVTKTAIDRMQGASTLTKELVRCEIDAMRAKLGFDQAPMLEKLLIDQICACYLRMWMAEHRHTACLNDSDRTIEQGTYDQKVLGMAQARYLRAVETLARVRRLKLPALQVNVAQAGAKQMNVAASEKANL